MARSESILHRLPLPLIALGIALLAAGVVMQSRGIAIPAMLGSDTTFGIMAKIGGAVALVGVLTLGFAQMRTADRADDRFSRLSTEIEIDDLPPSVTPQRMAEWQRRLAEKAAIPGAEAEQAPPPRRLGSHLHRAALAIVGAAFVVLLGLTIWNQVAASLSAPPAPVVAAPMDTAETIAARADEAIVPDTPADRHWTAIDMSGLSEFFMAQTRLAMTGDRDAILMFAAMFGGVIALLIALRIYLVLRRVNAMRSRPRDISTMGYN